MESDINMIVKKIALLKEKKSKAEGAIENIRATWKEKYGLNSAEEVEAKIKELASEIEKLIEKKKALEEEIMNLTDWSSI